MGTKTPLAAVILAAGKSTRMNLLPKATIIVAGKPMGQRVLEAVKSVAPQEVVVVVGHQAEQAKAVFGDECKFALQQPQLGTAHALQMSEPHLAGFSGDLLVVNTDHPLISRQDLQNLLSHHRESGAAASLLTWQRTEEMAYGRIIRDAAGQVIDIVEVKDATPEQLALREVNLSMYCFAAPLIFEVLRQIRSENAQNEFYLTDAIGLLARAGQKVEAVAARNPETGFGVNTPEELARAEACLQQSQAL